MEPSAPTPPFSLLSYCSPTSFFLLIQQSSTYLTHMGIWGALCCFRVIQLNLPCPRNFQLTRLELLLVSCIPTGPRQWLSPLLMDGALAMYLSLFYDFSSSKASSVATYAEWTGTMDATLPFPEQHEELASWLLLALCFLRKGLNVHSRMAFSSSMILPESLSLGL